MSDDIGKLTIRKTVPFEMYVRVLDRAAMAEAVLHLYAEAQRWATGTEEHRLALQKADTYRAALNPSPAGRVVTHEEGARLIQEPEPDDGAIVHEDGSVTRPSPAGSSWRCADCGAEPPITCNDRTCAHYNPSPAEREG